MIPVGPVWPGAIVASRVHTATKTREQSTEPHRRQQANSMRPSRRWSMTGIHRQSLVAETLYPAARDDAPALPPLRTAEPPLILHQSQCLSAGCNSQTYSNIQHYDYKPVRCHTHSTNIDTLPQLTIHNQSYATAVACSN